MYLWKQSLDHLPIARIIQSDSPSMRKLYVLIFTTPGNAICRNACVMIADSGHSNCHAGTKWVGLLALILTYMILL